MTWPCRTSNSSAARCCRISRESGTPKAGRTRGGRSDWRPSIRSGNRTTSEGMEMKVVAPTIETVKIKHCGFEAKVRVEGSGPPVVFFHTAGGPYWERSLDLLAE